MTAQLLDGTALSKKLRAQLAIRVAALAARGHRPGLAVVLVGEDAASRIYVRNKARACADVCIHSEMLEMPVSTSEAELLAQIDRLNADAAIHGILVQMPLPRQIDPARVIEAIALAKDVDGFHLLSAGALVTGRIDSGIGGGIGYRPCTPYGVIAMLDDANIPIAGAHAVVIGRSNTVGKPMALMLLARNATVTICHSATRDLAGMVRQADIVVAAVGRPHIVTAGMVKPQAVVIDVGMNRNAEGKLTGDVDFDDVREVASWITPVPGGVGPMTITMLLTNAVTAAERAAAIA
ncbi:MAG: bifunctional 5,10-methylenetetrahydrofolate dehydrogenase/5,10-methenyltetrahydrofolate cyclohydrolase [Burkholderiaceae bacterium]